MELEGLRGVAAIIVVLFHTILMFYPGFFYGPASYDGAHVQGMRFEDKLYGNPIMGLLTGSFSVAIFFVLSGFVLSVGFLKTGDRNVIKRLATKRYARLMLPVLAAIFFAYVIMASGLDIWRGQAVTITHSVWLAGLWPQTPNFWEALVQGIYSVFTVGSASYDPVLWTIKYELIGSFIIFGMALLFLNSRYRWVTYVILGLAFASSWYLGFIIGMVLADLYVNYKRRLQSIPSWVLVICAVIGVGLGAFPPTSLVGTLFQWIQLPNMTQLQNMSFYLTIGATLVILATLLLPRLTKFFSHPRIAVLGKYTFALYLVHLPILLSLGLGIFVGLHNFIGVHKAIVVSMGITLPVVTLVTYLFEKFIDAPSIKLSSFVADMYSGNRVFTFDFRQLRTHFLAYIVLSRRWIVEVLGIFSYQNIKSKYVTWRAADEDIE